MYKAVAVEYKRAKSRRPIGATDSVCQGIDATRSIQCCAVGVKR